MGSRRNKFGDASPSTFVLAMIRKSGHRFSLATNAEIMLKQKMERSIVALCDVIASSGHGTCI
jgi:hypothetical protein